MSTGKMLLIGAGVAAVAVGTYFLARWAYKHGYLDNVLGTQQTPLLQGGNQKDIDYEGSSREISAVAPALAPYVGYAKNVETSTQVVPLPDAVTFGLGWDVDSSEDINVDLVAAAFNSEAVMLGYVQGYYCRSLFNGSITHTGDDTKGGTAGKLSSVLGDNENVVIEFRQLPPEVYSIVVGVHLVQPYSSVLNSYCHMLPLFREEHVATTDELRTQLRAIDLASAAPDQNPYPYAYNSTPSQYYPNSYPSYTNSNVYNNPYGSIPQQAMNPYGSVPQQAMNPYGSAPQQAMNPYGSAPQQAMNPYGSAPQQAIIPYASAPQQAQVFNTNRGDDDDDDDSDDSIEDPRAKKEARQAFIRLFHADIDSQPNFLSCGGFVAGRCQRDYYTGKWIFQPVRQTVQVEPNQGIWPWLAMYAR